MYVIVVFIFPVFCLFFVNLLVGQILKLMVVYEFSSGIISW